MFWLTQDAVIVCNHQLGKVATVTSQQHVRVDSRPVMIEPDPESRPISGCPNYGPGIKPCTTTLKVQAGYSSWIRIDGRSVCLDTVTGYSDGTPPGVVKYVVTAPGQHWIEQR
jgi:hypothetical protein